MRGCGFAKAPRPKSKSPVSTLPPGHYQKQYNWPKKEEAKLHGYQKAAHFIEHAVSKGPTFSIYHK